jgi:hypothetical protein
MHDCSIVGHCQLMLVVDASQAFADPEADPVSLKGRRLWASEQQQGSSVFGVTDRALEPDVEDSPPSSYLTTK